MKRIISAALLLAAASMLLDRGSFAPVSAAGADEQGYFNSLVKRPDIWKSYSLRDRAQVASREHGGYINAPSNAELFINYSPDTDNDRHRQDAAKVVIPAFNGTVKLTQAVSATDTVLTLVAAYRPTYSVGRVMKVDNEVLTVVTWLSDTTISVARGAYGTAPAPHAAGAVLKNSTNNLPTQLRLPLGTQDDHSYFFTWDGYWTDSYLGAGSFRHKAFQFSSGSNDGDAIFFEPGTNYGMKGPSCWNQSIHVASVAVRSYNMPASLLSWLLTDGDSLGPGAVGPSPLGPGGEFCFAPNQWVRFFVNLRQRQNDYDYVDMWVADETQEPVQVLDNVPISVRPDGSSPNSIKKFWIEFNSSENNYLRPDGRDLVAYVRNFVALQDAGDPRSLLVRPVPGALPAGGPAAPRNVRIISAS